MMKPEIKKIWVDALRSGEYKRARLRLRIRLHDETEDRFCCLGVLCDLHQKETGEGSWDAIGYYLQNDDPNKGSCYNLPSFVLKWAGLKDFVPIVNGEKLSLMNDVRLELEDNTYGNIPDLIEEFL